MIELFQKNDDLFSNEELKLRSSSTDSIREIVTLPILGERLVYTTEKGGRFYVNDTGGRIYINRLSLPIDRFRKIS